MTNRMANKCPRRLIVDHWPLVVLLFVYLVVAVAYSVVGPIFEPPEEWNHFRYVQYLIQYRALPVLEVGQPSESHQPPLYYTLSALLIALVDTSDFPALKAQSNPFRGYHSWEVGRDNKNLLLHGPWDGWPYRNTSLAVHLIRWMSVLMGASTVVFTYAIGLRLLGRRSPALIAAAVLAFNPMFLFVSGSINNDNLAILLGTATLFVALILVAHGPSRRAGIWLGVLMGLGGLTKVTTAFLAPAVALALLACVVQHRKKQGTVGKTAMTGLTAAGIALLLAGPIYVRNTLIYGDPTAVRQDFAVWTTRTVSEGLAVMKYELVYTWTTAWGRFGYGDVPFHSAVYRALAIGTGLAVLGLALRVVRWLRGRPRPNTLLWQLGVLVMATVMLWLATLAYALINPTAAVGRYTFPALAAMTTLIAMGLEGLAPWRWNLGLTVIIVVTMVGLGLYGLMILHNAYAPPPALTVAQAAAIPHQTDVTFGTFARLRGYALDRDTVQPGERFQLTLYWEALGPADRNYALFAHVLNDQDIIVAQRDTHPGLGTYPTRAWQAGRLFADVIPIDVPETACAPDQLHLSVGFYEHGGNMRAPAIAGGERLVNNAALLGSLALSVRPGSFPNALDVDFDHRIALRGYAFDRRVLRPGEALQLTFYWQALALMDENYAVFAHLLGEGTQVWGSGDGWPVDGRSPTATWVPGQIITDTRTIIVGATTPAGLYDLEMGWVDSNRNRLPTVAADGHWLDNRVLLCKIRVE